MSSTHPVIQVLTSRRARESVPGQREDDFRVGLAVEGGGMRGALSAAMMSALGDYGFTDSFDAIYAYSAGAINSAYFISGGGWHSLSVYYDELIGGEFIDYRRLLRGGPLVSLDFVLDVVMEQRQPLDYARIIASPVELNLVASSVDKIRPHTFKNFSGKADIQCALKASACIPLIAGPPVICRGERFVDGAVLLSHPFLAAKADGCTHILVIRTRSDKSAAGRMTIGKMLMAQRLERLQPGMKNAVLSTINSYADTAAEVKQQSLHGTGMPYVLDVACPEGSHRVGRFTQDRTVIYQGIRQAYGAMLEALTGRREQILLRPASFRAGLWVGLWVGLWAHSGRELIGDMTGDLECPGRGGRGSVQHVHLVRCGPDQEIVGERAGPGENLGAHPRPGADDVRFGHRGHQPGHAGGEPGRGQRPGHFRHAGQVMASCEPPETRV
jgi:predicted patatin/cPLA2 family phospholipase